MSIKKQKTTQIGQWTENGYDYEGLVKYGMHYLENGYYWYKENLETFKSYVRLSDDEQIPKVPEVELPIVLSETGKGLDLPEKQKDEIKEFAQKQFITQWLKTRESKLRQEFDEAMSVFGVEYISQKEIDQI